MVFLSLSTPAQSDADSAGSYSVLIRMESLVVQTTIFETVMQGCSMYHSVGPPCSSLNQAFTVGSSWYWHRYQKLL